jgi:hypothetical protein
MAIRSKVKIRTLRVHPNAADRVEDPEESREECGTPKTEQQIPPRYKAPGRKKRAPRSPRAGDRVRDDDSTLRADSYARGNVCLWRCVRSRLWDANGALDRCERG